MEKLKICNWEKWQTYRADRGQPPWIKIHRQVLRNLEWTQLTDEEKGQLVCLWILGADNNGTIPADPALIKKLCLLEKEPKLSRFIELEFLRFEKCQDDATATPPRRQGAAVNDAEKQKQNREEKNIGQNPLKKNTPKNTPKLGHSKKADFPLFWAAYPNKVAKVQAQKTWDKLSSEKKLPSLSVILSAINAQIDWRARAQPKEFRPEWKNPSTWLNAGCWTDEVDCTDTPAAPRRPAPIKAPDSYKADHDKQFDKKPPGQGAQPMKENIEKALANIGKGD